MEFTVKTIINATAQEIYDAWLSSEGHAEMTGGEAHATAEVGGKFTAWDGYITGKTLELDPNHRIVQSWRTSQFEDGEEDSMIEILLQEMEGQTSLTLNHTKVPESGKHYIKGWENSYFQPMKDYFDNKK